MILKLQKPDPTPKKADQRKSVIIVNDQAIMLGIAEVPDAEIDQDLHAGNVTIAGQTPEIVIEIQDEDHLGSTEEVVETDVTIVIEAEIVLLLKDVVAEMTAKIIDPLLVNIPEVRLKSFYSYLGPQNDNRGEKRRNDERRDPENQRRDASKEKRVDSGNDNSGRTEAAETDGNKF